MNASSAAVMEAARSSCSKPTRDNFSCYAWKHAADQYCPDDGSQCEDLCDSGERLCDGEFCIQDDNCCLATADDDCPFPFFCPDDDEPCQCSYDDGTPCCSDGEKDCGGKCIPEDTCCTSDDCNWDEYCPTAGEACAGRCDEGYKLCGEWCYEKPEGGDVCCLSNPGGDDCGEATTGEQLTCPEDGGTCSCGDDKKACPSDDGISCINSDQCCPALDECSEPYVCIDFQCRCPEGQKECYNSESDSTTCIPEDSCCIWDEDCPEDLFCPEDGGLSGATRVAVAVDECGSALDLSSGQVDRATQDKQSAIVRAQGEAQSARLIGQAIQQNPAFLSLRKIEAARDIATTIAHSANRVFLNADSLLLNLGDLGTQGSHSK
eukprot:gene9485-9649_t